MKRSCRGSLMQTRPGFITVDIAVGLSLLFMGLVFVGQTTVWSIAERKRSEVLLQALEAVANVLESAKTVPVEKLETWAAEQKLPEDVAQQMQSPKLAVRVTRVKDRPQTRKVEVELTWLIAEGKPASPVTLVGFFTPHEIVAKGDKP